MKSAAKFFLIPLLFLVVSQADARVEWNEPEVVPEKLVRKNRRVLRFSGVTTPGAQVRIKKNRLKLYLNSGKTRRASIPQKNRIQFPVVADDDGQFTFDLYLPTIAVQIPVQVRTKGKWRTYALNFRVPEDGAADDFEAVEESFRANDEAVARLDQDDNYYSEKNDQGLLIKDRHGYRKKKSYNVEVWGGLAISYFSTTVNSTSQAPITQPDRSGTAIVIPAWRLGGQWDYSQALRFKGNLRSASGSTSDIATAGDTGTDFNWLEFDLGALWFADFFKFKNARMALDFGLQYHSLPFYRQRTGFSNQTYFENDTYNFHIGVHYENSKSMKWNYEAYARYIYPVSVGDAFDNESTFPMNFEFGGGVKRDLSRGLAFGVFGQLNYFSMDTKYNNTGIDVNSDLTLMLFSVDARLIGRF